MEKQRLARLKTNTFHAELIVYHINTLKQTNDVTLNFFAHEFITNICVAVEISPS